MMPHLLRNHTRNGTFISSPKYMNEVAHDMNRYILKFASNNSVSKNHFSRVSMDVHPLVVSAARKLRILAKPTQDFVKEIENAWRTLHGLSVWSAVDIKITHPVMWAHNENKRYSKDENSLNCLAFVNLALSYPIPQTRYNSGNISQTNMASENPWTPKHTIGFANQLERDLKCEHRKQSWLPFARGRRRLNSRRVMSLTRILARYVFIDNLHIEAKTIDNLAQKIIDTYKPMSFHETKTLQDMRDMYTKNSTDTPGSCMDSTHGFYVTKPHEPVDWYHYCPTTKGFCVKRGDTVLARTIAYFNSTDKKWYYTRIYSSRDLYRRKLEQELKNLGVGCAVENSLLRQLRTAEDIEFDIPLSKYNGKDSCPVPYFDFVPASYMWIRVKDGVNKCLLTPSTKKPNGSGWVCPNIATTNGGHVYEYGNQRSCGYCDNDIYDDDCPIRAPDGAVFCSSDCASEADYMRWQTSDNCEWRPYALDHKENISCLYEPTVFSNFNAALESCEGVFVYWHPWADVEVPIMRSVWAVQQGWGFSSTDVLHYHGITHPITGKKIVSSSGRQQHQVCYPHAYTKRSSKYAQVLPTGGIGMMFLEIPGEHKRLSIYRDNGMTKAILENKSKFVKIDNSNGHSSEAVEFSFTNQYFDFMDLDKSSKTRVLSHAQTVEGVTIINQPKKENV